MSPDRLFGRAEPAGSYILCLEVCNHDYCADFGDHCSTSDKSRTRYVLIVIRVSFVRSLIVQERRWATTDSATDGVNLIRY